MDNCPMALTELPVNLPGKLYRSPMPFGMFDPMEEVYDAYGKCGVEVVVVLNEASEIRRVTGRDLTDLYREDGLEVLHFPILDFSIPDRDAFIPAVERTLAQLKEGKTVAVHCHAGLGRTGLFLAVLARLAMGYNGQQAITWVRRYVPDAVQTTEQVRFIMDVC